MCANPQSNWLNTIAVRASYILPILKRFPWWKPRKTGGWSISPRKKNQNRNQFVFLSFGVDPLNWQSFIEIGEMACSTTAWCSRSACARNEVFRRLSVVEKPRKKDILFQEVQFEQNTKYLFRLLQIILTRSHWSNYCLLQWLVKTKRLILILYSEQTTPLYRVVESYFWLILLVWKLIYNWKTASNKNFKHVVTFGMLGSFSVGKENHQKVSKTNKTFDQSREWAVFFN